MHIKDKTSVTRGFLDRFLRRSALSCNRREDRGADCAQLTWILGASCQWVTFGTYRSRTQLRRPFHFPLGSRDGRGLVHADRDVPALSFSSCSLCSSIFEHLDFFSLAACFLMGLDRSGRSYISERSSSITSELVSNSNEW